MKMLSKKQYDLVSEDGYDARIPLHNDDAFQHGIHFQTKYIGTLDVSRPSSRVEIVAAMRKIRCDFKVKGVKKKKVCLTISVDGVKLTLCRKQRRSISTSSNDEHREVLMHHPIFRIFYVSHDSQDLKIWSFIARDGPSNCFKCSVFKAYKKNQAMRIVRTIGQAFEVCHKLSLQHTNKSVPNKDTCDSGKGKDRKGMPLESQLSQSKLSASTRSSPLPSSEASKVSLTDPAPISTHHHVMLLRQQIEQQQHQTQLAIGQVHLLKDQLTSETAARIEAQARSHQLLMHNRDMLDQMSQLVARLQELELKVNGSLNNLENILPPPSTLQIPVLPDPTTPQAGPVYTPEMEKYFPTKTFDKGLGSDFDTDSPDSGHKEMSTESLASHFQKSNTSYWQNILNGQLVSISSPTQYVQVEDVSSVTGNPFASGFDDSFEHDNPKQGSPQIITPNLSQDACGNRLELKLTRMPKIAPPPEFRNSKSTRDSQYSVQSIESMSSQDTAFYVKGSDSDYYSNTLGSAVSHNTASDNMAPFSEPVIGKLEYDPQKGGDCSPQEHNSLDSSIHSCSSTNSELSRIQKADAITLTSNVWTTPNSKKNDRVGSFTDFKTIDQREISASPKQDGGEQLNKKISSQEFSCKEQNLKMKKMNNIRENSVFGIKPAPPPPPPRTVDKL